MCPPRTPEHEASAGCPHSSWRACPAAGVTGDRAGGGPGTPRAWQPGAGPAPIPGLEQWDPGAPKPSVPAPCPPETGTGDGLGSRPHGWARALRQARLTFPRALHQALGGAGPEGRPPAPRAARFLGGSFCTCSAPTGERLGQAADATLAGGPVPICPLGALRHRSPRPQRTASSIQRGTARVRPSPLAPPLSPSRAGFPQPLLSHPARPQALGRIPGWDALPSWSPPSQRPGPETHSFGPHTSPLPLCNQLLGLKSQLHHVTAVWPEAAHTASLGFPGERNKNSTCPVRLVGTKRQNT